ncbi:MAG: DNA topoisomerase IB, partial [Longimicrobiales bacterium]
MTSTTSTDKAGQLGPEIVARRAGLTYVTSEAHGITRRRHGRGFAYHNGVGKLTLDPQTRERIDG